MSTHGILAPVSRKLHLGCGKSPKDGWNNLDQCNLPGVDTVFDLGNCKNVPLPFEDNSFDEVYGSHVIEHIVDTLSLMQELHRVCSPDACLIFQLPYGSSDDAWENPTHVRPYFMYSFNYFSQPFFWREDYGFTGDWQPERLVLKVKQERYGPNPLPARLMNDVMLLRNVVQEMVIFMRCVKPIREPLMELQQAPKLEFELI